LLPSAKSGGEHAALQTLRDSDGTLHSAPAPGVRALQRRFGLTVHGDVLRLKCCQLSYKPLSKGMQVGSISRGAIRAALLTSILAVTSPVVLPCSAQDQSTPSAANILKTMERVADWQLANPSSHAPGDWTQGAGYTGMMALAGISGDPKYRDAMMAMAEKEGWKLWRRMYHADDHVIGQTYAELFLQYRDPKMIAPMQTQFDNIIANPRVFPTLDFTQRGIGDEWSWCYVWPGRHR